MDRQERRMLATESYAVLVSPNSGIVVLTKSEYLAWEPARMERFWHGGGVVYLRGEPFDAAAVAAAQAARVTLSMPLRPV